MAIRNLCWCSSLSSMSRYKSPFTAELFVNLKNKLIKLCSLLVRYDIDLVFVICDTH